MLSFLICNLFRFLCCERSVPTAIPRILTSNFPFIDREQGVSLWFIRISKIWIFILNLDKRMVLFTNVLCARLLPLDIHQADNRNSFHTRRSISEVVSRNSWTSTSEVRGVLFGHVYTTRISNVSISTSYRLLIGGLIQNFLIKSRCTFINYSVFS